MANIKIEMREFGEIPDFIHEIMTKLIMDYKDVEDTDVLTAQYLDMLFRAGYQSAKSFYETKR